MEFQGQTYDSKEDIYYMENLISFDDLNENRMTYDKDKLYSYAYIKQSLKGAPAYMRDEIKKLKQVPTTNSNGKEYIGTKISARVFAYVFKKHW